MSTAPTGPSVAYDYAACRHWTDAETLFSQGRSANAGQLYGFVAECGLKAMLLACGIAPSADGGVSQPWRQHMPSLIDRITANGQLIPDGPQSTRYMATMPNLTSFDNWSVDHRYWSDAALAPLFASVPAWRVAAKEVSAMLDQAKQDGVL